MYGEKSTKESALVRLMLGKVVNSKFVVQVRVFNYYYIMKIWWQKYFKSLHVNQPN